MTPEYKAKELIKKFKESTQMDMTLPANKRWGHRDANAKRHAIICLDEILDVIDTDYLDWWNEVKTELTKL